MNPTLINWLLLGVLITLWGTGFAFIGAALEGFTPAGVAFSRLVIAATLITAFVLYRGERLPKDGKSWAVFCCLAFFGNAAPFYCIATGQQSISSGLTGLLMAVMPLFTLVLAHYLIPGETLNRYKLLGFALGISGVYLVVNHSIGASQGSIFPALLILMAAACYAINTVLARKLVTLSITVTSAGVLLLACLQMLPLVIMEGLYNPAQPMSTSALASMIWVGVGPTALATVVYFKVIERAGPSFLANINYCIPVVAYFVGATILQEPIDRYSLMAIPVILLGLAVSRRTVTAQ